MPHGGPCSADRYSAQTPPFNPIQAGYSPLRTCYNENAAPSTTNYTSARLTTRDSAAFKWKGTAGNSTAVRIDVRLQVPMGEATAQGRVCVCVCLCVCVCVCVYVCMCVCANTSQTKPRGVVELEVRCSTSLIAGRE